MKHATLFASRGEAEYCADCNNRDADGWLFKVVLTQGRYAVAAYDEDNNLVGYL